MQSDQVSSFSEVETIELPVATDECGRRSSFANGIFWIAVLAASAGATYAMYFLGVAQASGATHSSGMSAVPPVDSVQLSGFLSGGSILAPSLPAVASENKLELQSLMANASESQVPLALLKSNPFRAPDLTITGNIRPTTNPDTQLHTETSRAQLLEAVDTMQLQSIDCSDTHRSCMISNVLYDEGGIINGFTVEQINARTVIVRNGLYRFELTVNR